jgi:uncharacterized protein YkwD
MRRAALLLTVSAALSVLAAPARAGTPIATLPACEHSYLYYAPGVSRADFRAALLCLLNGARKAQHLPALRRSAPLEAVGQAQSDAFAASGSASHGKSLTDIAKRFARHGYRVAAYNEGFAVLDPRSSPYAFLADMLARAGVPCTEILDPRFRDVGIGVSVGKGGVVDTLALELGRKVGTSQPSATTKAAATCGHKLPKPLVSGPAVEGRGDPVATDTTVTVRLQWHGARRLRADRDPRAARRARHGARAAPDERGRQDPGRDLQLRRAGDRDRRGGGAAAPEPGADPDGAGAVSGHADRAAHFLRAGARAAGALSACGAAACTGSTVQSGCPGIGGVRVP